MSDAEYEEQKQRAEAVFEKWSRTLGLGWWDVKAFYHRESPPRDGNYFSPVMCVECEWRYLLASIHIYVPEIVNMSDDDLEESILHEIAHIFVSELRGQTPDDHLNHEERVVTWMARSWRWVWQEATEAVTIAR